MSGNQDSSSPFVAVLRGVVSDAVIAAYEQEVVQYHLTPMTPIQYAAPMARELAHTLRYLPDTIDLREALATTDMQTVMADKDVAAVGNGVLDFLLKAAPPSPTGQRFNIR